MTPQSILQTLATQIWHGSYENWLFRNTIEHVCIKNKFKYKFDKKSTEIYIIKMKSCCEWFSLQNQINAVIFSLKCVKMSFSWQHEWMNVWTRKNAHCIEIDIALNISPHHNKLSGYEPIFLFFSFVFMERKKRVPNTLLLQKFTSTTQLPIINKLSNAVNNAPCVPYFAKYTNNERGSWEWGNVLYTAIASDTYIWLWSCTFYV